MSTLDHPDFDLRPNHSQKSQEKEESVPWVTTTIMDLSCI